LNLELSIHVFFGPNTERHILFFVYRTFPDRYFVCFCRFVRIGQVQKNKNKKDEKHNKIRKSLQKGEFSMNLFFPNSFLSFLWIFGFKFWKETGKMNQKRKKLIFLHFRLFVHFFDLNFRFFVFFPIYFHFFVFFFVFIRRKRVAPRHHPRTISGGCTIGPPQNFYHQSAPFNNFRLDSTLNRTYLFKNRVIERDIF